jgi:hypothetical protein
MKSMLQTLQKIKKLAFWSYHSGCGYALEEPLPLHVGFVVDEVPLVTIIL